MIYRKKGSKQKSLEKHTRNRLRERYGLNYTQRLFEWLINQMSEGETTLVCKQSNRVSVHDCSYYVQQGDICNSELARVGWTTIRFVYDKERKTLITVLTLEMNPNEYYGELS